MVVAGVTKYRNARGVTKNCYTQVNDCNGWDRMEIHMVMNIECVTRCGNTHGNECSGCDKVW